MERPLERDINILQKRLKRFENDNLVLKRKLRHNNKLKKQAVLEFNKYMDLAHNGDIHYLSIMKKYKEIFGDFKK